jgi:hypothetical protein
MGYRKCRSVRSAQGDFQNEPCLVNCLNFVAKFWVKIDGHESAEPTLDRDSPIAHIVLPVNGRIYLALNDSAEFPIQFDQLFEAGVDGDGNFAVRSHLLADFFLPTVAHFDRLFREGDVVDGCLVKFVKPIGRLVAATCDGEFSHLLFALLFFLAVLKFLRLNDLARFVILTTRLYGLSGKSRIRSPSPMRALPLSLTVSISKVPSSATLTILCR